MTSTADPWAEPTPGTAPPDPAPQGADDGPPKDNPARSAGPAPEAAEEPTSAPDEAPQLTPAERRAARKTAAAAKRAAAAAAGSGAGAVADPTAPDEVTDEANRPVEPPGAEAPAETEAPAEAPAEVKKERVRKSAAAKPRGELGSLLQGSLAAQETILSVLLYGPEGTGKTTDALRMTQLCADHQRVVLVDAEAGAKIQALKQRGIDVGKIIPWPLAEDGGPAKVNYDGLSELSDQIEEANAGSQGKVIIGAVWDSGTEITKRILDQVVEMAEEKDRRLGKNRAAFQINLEDHGVASSMLRALLRRYRDLGVHLVITALERRDQDPDTGKIKYGPAMSPAMANDAAGLVDIVGYTMVEEVGESKTEIRSARFVPIERRRAKDRYGLLPGKMPDPYFDRIFGYVEGSINKDIDPVRARVMELAGVTPAGADQAADTTAPAAAPTGNEN